MADTLAQHAKKAFTGISGFHNWPLTSHRNDPSHRGRVCLGIRLLLYSHAMSELAALASPMAAHASVQGGGTGTVSFSKPREGSVSTFKSCKTSPQGGE